MDQESPTFLIVGAAKSGTTSMYHYLNEHPEVYMCPVKEPDYFGGYWWKLPLANIHGKNPELRILQDWNEYSTLFQESSVTCMGEASPSTLFYYEKSIPEIKNRLGDPKIIILLRNPVERAYSHYSFLKRDGKENLTFSESLKAEESRKKNNFHYGYFYRSVGFYSDQVNAFMDNFSNVHVCFFEDLKSDPLHEFHKICRFLQVSDAVTPHINTIHNRSGNPKLKWLNAFLRKKNPVRDFIRPVIDTFLTDQQKSKFVENIHGMNLKSTDEMPVSVREELIETYRSDIESLGKCTGKDLSHWV